jgi:hypothetical protein
MDGNELSTLDDQLEEELLLSDILLLSAIQAAILCYSMNSIPSLAIRTSSLTGAEYSEEILNCGHYHRIKESCLDE